MAADASATVARTIGGGARVRGGSEGEEEKKSAWQLPNNEKFSHRLKRIRLIDCG